MASNNTEARIRELRGRLHKLESTPDVVAANLRTRLAQLRGLPEDDPGRDPEKIRQCERGLADVLLTTLNGQLVGIERRQREATEDRAVKLAKARQQLVRAENALQAAGDPADLDNLLAQLRVLTDRCRRLQNAVDAAAAATTELARVEGDTRGLDKLAASVETLREKIRQRDAEREAIERELTELSVVTTAPSSEPTKSKRPKAN